MVGVLCYTMQKSQKILAGILETIFRILNKGYTL